LSIHFIIMSLQMNYQILNLFNVLLCPMVVKKVVTLDDEILHKLQEVLENENSKKPKGEKLTIRILPEEISLYQLYVDLTEFKNVSELIRKAVREKIKSLIIPNNPVEQRFLGTWGIHRKIGKAIEKQVLSIENEIEKLVENIDVNNIDEDLLIDFIQKQQVSSAIAISLLRKKKQER